MEAGAGWRRHAWTASRAALMPRLPLEVLRRRLARARQVGLDYSTYASFRAGGGDDIIAILFSSNALRLIRPGDGLPDDRAARLASILSCGRGLLAVAPADPGDLNRRIEGQIGEALDLADRAPGLSDSWSRTRERLAAAVQAARWPASRVFLVGDTTLERDWTAAGKFAGYVTADRYFQTQSQPHS